jgi:hypothetical protein
MVRARPIAWLARGSVALLLLGIGGSESRADSGPADRLASRRAFASSRFSIDETLARPFDRDVPMGCTGARVWASSPQGWAFRDDVHWLDLTGFDAFDLEIRDEHGLLEPADATYHPSHIHFGGARRKAITASASFTFALDNVDNPLVVPFEPRKRWTCWSSGARHDWYAIDLAIPRKVTGFDLFFFDDAPHGECRPPRAYDIEYFDGGNRAWTRVTTSRIFPEQPRPGENRVRFEPVESSRFRLVFHHAGDRSYTGLYGIVPEFVDTPATTRTPIGLHITCDKFITADDTLVSIVRVRNPNENTHTIYVDPIIATDELFEAWDVETRWPAAPGESQSPSGHEPRSISLRFRQRLKGYDVDCRFRYAVVDDPPAALSVSSGGTASGIRSGLFAKRWLSAANPGAYKAYGHPIGPGQAKVFKGAIELRVANEPSTIDAVVKPANDRTAVITAEAQDARDPLAAHMHDYQAWFDANIPYFECSDPWVRKLYYHRAYVLRKNMLDPKLGRLRWPVQSEGRWRSTWYPNVISYGGGHQIREARWLRDPKYWQGHLRTWAENEKSDGVYPSHVTISGPAGGQYTDWITSTAWDGHLVQPDRVFLAQVVEKLAANVRGWQKQYDPDGDGLSLVDSHWWTGMEYQPSFFFFADYKVTRDFSEPANRVSLDRVDLTSYCYGDSVAVARIYHLLGQHDRAQEFDELAARIATAVLTKMWQPEKRFFYSLRTGDHAVADAKEVIGVYPFYFDMVPSGKGYESAWGAIVDPDQFWTHWPVASASRQCPAFSQSNWPGDGRAATCMWNGPTWPHANSLVMSAMARTVRAARDHKVADCPLERRHLWELFSSFTRAQFRNQDLRYPWTGEFYNGDTGQWKTAERDYNHSTWLDILIPELLGIVPRDDEILEIDPLLPETSLSYFLLDGLRYHGHDIAIAWDAPTSGLADHFGDSRKGLDVYVDGKRVASAGRLSRLGIELPPARP